MSHTHPYLHTSRLSGLTESDRVNNNLSRVPDGLLLEHPIIADRFLQSRVHQQIKEDDVYKELEMLGEYVDDFAPHPVHTQFFEDFLQANWQDIEWKHQARSHHNTSDLTKIWKNLSDRQKIQVYRSYIDEMIRDNESDNTGNSPIQHPEATEWYDDYFEYQHQY